jgi:hypothetical protein
MATEQALYTHPVDSFLHRTARTSGTLGAIPTVRYGVTERNNNKIG